VSVAHRHRPCASRPRSRLCPAGRRPQIPRRLSGFLHAMERRRPRHPHPSASQGRVRETALRAHPSQRPADNTGISPLTPAGDPRLHPQICGDAIQSAAAEVYFWLAHVGRCFSVAKELIVRHPPETVAQFFHFHRSVIGEAIHAHSDRNSFERIGGRGTIR
jgi:hypothetical protein